MNLFKAADWIGEDAITLFQRLYTVPEAAHVHQFYEIVYIYEGQGSHTVNGVERRVARGDMLLLGFHDVHAFVPDGAMGVFNCLIAPGFIDTQLQSSTNIMDVLLLHTFGEFAEFTAHALPGCTFSGQARVEIEQLLARMLEEAEAKRSGYRLLLRSYLDVLLVSVFRRIWQLYGQEAPVQAPKIAPEVLAYIEQNYNKKISVSALAAQSHYNAAYFSRRFKQSFGISLTGYIHQKRIFMAMHYLRDSDLPVERIRRLIGFSNKNQFYRKFTQATGYTPAAYRKAQRT